MWTALAVAFGAAGGLAAAPHSLWGLIALVGVLIAGTAWIAGWAAADGEPALGAARDARTGSTRVAAQARLTPASVQTRPTLVVADVRPAPGRAGTRPSLALLAALAAAAFARATFAPASASPAPASPALASPASPGSASHAAAVPANERCDDGALEGTWCARGAVHGRELGTLAARTDELVELGVGWTIEGERVRVLASADRTRAARGLDASAGPGRSVWTPRADELVRLAPSTTESGAFTRLRVALLAACDRAGGVEHGPLLRALVCGDTSRFDAQTLDLFTRTGTRHLLAVSGQHVTWIAAFALRPLSRLLGGLLGWFLPRRAAWVRELLFLAAVLVYVPLAGGASPVRRAAVAFVLAVAAGVLLERARGGRRVDVLSLWSTALLAELTLAPRAIGEVALLLSYAATLGLLLGAAPLARLVSRSPRFELSESWPSALRRRLRSALALACGASLAAVLATLPIAWSVFGEFSVPGAWITVVALPLFALLLLGAWLWVLVPGLALGEPCVAVAQALVAWFEFADRLPGTPLVLPPRPWAGLALASLATFAALAWRGSALGRRRAAVLAALTWSALLWPWTAAPQKLEVIAFDVGHGTAVALRAPGAGAWLFDGGSRDRTRVAQGAIAPCLAAWDVGSIGVVASHSDRDHVSALPWLVERFRARVWAGALADGVRAEALANATVLDLDSGTVRLPTAGPLALALVRGEARPGNLGSRSLRVDLGSRALLFCGDAEGAALAVQRASEAFEGPVDVLLAPHHGADPEGLGALLVRTAPRAVWISASRPAPILAELARRKLPVRQTWCDGALAFTTDGADP
ncbi:MAG: ComEC/Rec2 family competence protein [Planctomycetes bacterium]|nr:ComEC/Rec2 family competence protein [Planctomycetota bacterium]